MQLRLKALSHPTLGEISVRDGLYPIGRNEPPFSEFENDDVARLSRRHARLFIQDSTAYLIDLDSMNGTTLNGTPLGKEPMPLTQNDKICFAGKLDFQVSLEGDKPTGTTSSPRVILTLVPERLQAIVEPIVITEFPFLISKSDHLFNRYKSQLPEQYKFLSRRHAHIFVQDEGLMVEDLGSTNGTFVSDRRLEEHACPLKDADTIAFGGNDFFYRAHIKILRDKENRSLNESEFITDALPTSTDLTRTTFVTAASSFIDIFCLNDDADEDIQDDHDEFDKSSSQADAVTKSSERKQGKVSVFLKELRKAFASDEKNTSHFAIWSILIVASIAIGLISYSYFRQADIRDIETLFDQGAYVDVIDRADTFLKVNPDNAEIHEIALEALSQQLLPIWTRKMDAGEFQSAHQTIEYSRKLAPSIPLASPYFDLLAWMTSMEAYMSNRGGLNRPITLFKDEQAIRQLINDWDQSSAQFQKISSRVSQYVPEFETSRAKALSDLRTLRSEESLYIMAIDDFVLNLNRSLANNDLDEAADLIHEFEKKYPLVEGVPDLKKDLHIYRTIQNIIGSQAWLDAIELLKSTKFATPPFTERIEKLKSDELPPKNIAQQYQQAADAWLKGDGDGSIGILVSLKQSDWGKAAGVLLDHRKAVWNEYQAIRAHSSGSGRADKILKFYETLEPRHDSFFVEALASEYKAHHGKALAKAAQSINDARALWTKYLSEGRITGVTRLEASLSDDFRRQAVRLSDAYRKATLALDIYHLLDAEISESDLQLYRDILRESRLQKRSMLELKMVLEADLYDAKISLLPVLE